MKKVFLILIVLPFLYSAQNQRFIYDYSFVKDTLNKNNVSKELMYLDISKEGSIYYSRDVFVADSTMMKQIEKQVPMKGNVSITSSFSSAKSGIVRDKVSKTYPKYAIYLESKLGRDLYKVKDERPIVWTISSEKMKIGDWDSQKATTTFAGRTWIVWFSTELPFQDGPYKFHGLPGLIVKMEDATKTHQFELKGVSKFEQNIAANPQLNGVQGHLLINQEQYRKLFWENRDNPLKDLKQMMTQGAIVNFKNSSGTDTSQSDLMRVMEKNAKDKATKDNNLIEIELLKR